MRYARFVVVPRCLPAASTPVRSRRVGSSAILVSLLATALGLSAPQVTAAAASEPPVINMVKVTGTPAEPLLLVSGENFGSEQPSPTYPPGPCPERGTGLLFGQSFIFHDETREWTAGGGGEEGGGNCVGLSVVKWTTSNVEFRFGNDYLGANGQWTLEPGDSYQVTLYGVSHTGVAKYVELPKFLLTVADKSAGHSKGTVSSEPAGITCESEVPFSKCSEEYEETTRVKLTATPAAGSKFVKWSAGVCEGSEAPTCEVAMPNKATEVTAEFAELPKFLLAVADTGTGKGTVSSEPKGIECESVEPLTRCTEEFDEKAKLNLTATPAAGSKFVKWSAGPCEGSEASTCEFEMPGQATKVTAEFAKLLPKFLLTVSDTGTGNGTVSSEPAERGIKCESVVPLSKCTEELEEKTKVTLTATPAGGSKFVRWSGGPCVGSEAPTCEFEMPGKATKVRAEFAELPTVWLCQPGLANNPCESDLTTTVQLSNGSSFVKHSKPAKNPPIDCFYLYPQVSSQNTLNANLEIDPEQTQVAIDQASRFSQVCKVYAPMYPQLTVRGGFEFTPGEAAIAYDGALAAWRYYLANYNHGRGIVLIGHSLGATALKQLIKEQIDPNPALRHRLVSADLLGGQVTVPVGKDVGGDFQHVPACHAAWQTGCVVAYSSFLKEPPEPSYLGRVASPYFKTEPNPSLQILCVNPAALFGGDQAGRSEGDASGGSHGEHSIGSHGDHSGLLLPYQSTSPFPGTLGAYWQVAKAPTPWVSTPGQYSAQCKQANGASWLQLTAVPSHHVFPDEVQKLTVSATEGSITLVAPEKGAATFGFNATHEEVQTALEGPEGEYDEGRVRVSGTMFGKGNVQVTGGPGDEKGTKPYVITFTGSLAHQAVPLLKAFPRQESSSATVVEVTHGGDPRLQITETIGPLWGTHLVDVNIALGNLVGLTAVQARAYRAHRHDDHSG
jgi:Protein of unknown function (DUF3089)/Divergent InlB B-repeat domain